MIVLACRNLSGVVGGVEKMLTNLANNLVKRGHNILIITWDTLDTSPIYQLDDRIKWEKVGFGDLKVKSSLNQKIKRIIKLRKILNKHKVSHCLCFQLGTYNSIVTASFFKNIKVVALERNSLQRFSYTSKEFIWINYFFMLFAHKIVVQFSSYINDYPKLLRNKIISIPNFHDLEIIEKKMKVSNYKKIVYVGRFSFQKNIIFTLNTFIECCKIDEFVNFEFIGKGEMKDEMNNLIRNSGFDSRIKICNPKIKWYEDKEIDVLCLFSLWEGFPNVILEAFSNSILCIGSEKTKGIKDLLSNGRGILTEINSSKTLAVDLLESINNNLEFKNTILSNALNYSNIHKHSDIIPKWENLLK
jgi:glycosyltransferase involved in cell wall biosynthesis